MSVSTYLFGKLSAIADTYPLSAPIETKVPFITYSIDSTEVTKALSGRVAYTESFVTITVYEDEYDKSETLALQVKGVLGCSEELNILGATLNGKSNERIDEPVDRYSVALDYSIFER